VIRYGAASEVDLASPSLPEQRNGNNNFGRSRLREREKRDVGKRSKRRANRRLSEELNVSRTVKKGHRIPKCCGILLDLTRSIIRIKLELSILSAYIKFSTFRSYRLTNRFVTAKPRVISSKYMIKLISSYFEFITTLIQYRTFYRLQSCMQPIYFGFLLV
jgi:hypothetical protein